MSAQKLWRASSPWLSVVLLVALIVAPLGLFLWMVFSTDLFRVQAVTVLDGREHTTADVERIIEEELAKVPLQRTIFFVQTDVLEARIKSELPQLRTVKVERKLPDTLKVVLQEKTPTLLLLSNGTYYFVDEAGVPYEEAALHTLPGVVLPVVKNSDKEAKVTLGVPAVTAEFVSFMQHITEHLGDALKAKVAEIRIPSLAAREVHFILDSNWVVKFDVTRDPAGQLAVLGRIVKEMLEDGEQTSLEYIDLRIPNRAYYK
jgi:cell division septal protein FtsQ